MSAFTYSCAIDDEVLKTPADGVHKLLSIKKLMHIGLLLLAVYVLRVVFTFTYHFAIEELYEYGDFSETESEYEQRLEVDKDRKMRFQNRVDHLRFNNDLTTVRESFNDNEPMTVKHTTAANLIQAEGSLDYREGKHVGKSQSLMEKRKARAFGEEGSNNKHTSEEYHSFNFK